jgi:glycosyltransferase involved in cell wall biosynthesis
MKIAQIAPLYETVPPKLYGGTERVVAHLCDALIELGHQVTLFAAADAHTRADLVVARDQAIRLDRAPLKSDVAAHLSMLHDVRRRSALFDVLHFHIDLIHFGLFESLTCKTVTTVHGRLDIRDLPAAYARWPHFGLVAISEAQRKSLPQANWLATIGHGVAPGRYAFSETPRGAYLAFLGRLSPEKRPDVAVRVARRAGLPLRIAAKVDAADRAYFESVVKPLLDDPLVDFIGEIGDEHKSAFLGGAAALVFPIDWPEPFGLVLIEAMACGTPVIAWACGAVPEIVDHGVTGYIVSSEEEALAAVTRLGALDRRRIRAVFERRFGALTMARQYVEVYSKLIAPAHVTPRIAGIAQPL